MPRAVLTPHPETKSDAVEEIQAGAAWNHAGLFAFTFILKGDLTRLRIPKLRPPRRSDRLWEHTCFEAFLAITNKPEYYEINLAPSGDWAVFAFRGYRERAPLSERDATVEIKARGTEDTVRLDATVSVDGLSALAPGARLSVALCAVIEDNRGRLSYWALKHPPGKPDFHHADAFALEIERPVPSPSPSPRGRGKG